MSVVPKNGKVAVIGAGISGLSYGYFLSKIRPDVSIDIYEKSGRTGGWIHSKKVTVNNTPVILEKGPRTLRGVSDGTLLIVDILRQLGRGSSIQTLSHKSMANKKYIVNEAREIVQVPDSVPSAINFFAKAKILTADVVRGIFKEPWVKRSNRDESISDFFQRRFGSTTLTSKMLSAVIHGIYAGDVNKLSVQAILPVLPRFERESGSVIRAVVKALRKEKAERSLPPALHRYEKDISPQAGLLKLAKELKPYPMIKLDDGLEVLTRSLTEYLEKQPKVRFLYNSSITGVSQDGRITTKEGNVCYDHVRSTINTNVLNSLLAEKNNSLALPYVSVFLVNVYAPKGMNLIKNNGFGFLVPQHGGLQNSNPNSLLGVIYDSDVEKNVSVMGKEHVDRKECYEKITLMMGGHYFDENGIPSDKIRQRMVRNVLEEYLHMDLKKVRLVFSSEDTVLGDNEVLVSCDVHEECIPQFVVGYLDKRERVRNLGGRLSVGGMAFGNGVGVPDCVVNALEGAYTNSSDLRT